MKYMKWLAIVLITLVVFDAEARVGGGQGFSTGGGGGGFSGGGGGDGDGLGVIIYLIIRLCIEYPQIGFPLLAALLIFVAVRFWWSNRDQARQVHRLRSSLGRADKAPQRSAPTGRSRPKQALAERDTGFSEPVLFEFVQLVHRRSLDAHGTGTWDALLPFVSESGRDAISRIYKRISGFSDVVHAGVRMGGVKKSHGRQQLSITLLGSRVETRDGRQQPTYFEEIWSFERDASATSLPPDETMRLGCPSCGSAVETDSAGACVYCHTPITAGQLQWQATAVRIDVSRAIKPPQVSRFGGGDEPGALVASLVDPALATRYRSFVGRHPDFSQQAFLDRSKGIFTELQGAWSAGDWSKARPFVTDPLYNTLRFQMESYEKHNLHNRVADLNIERMDVVKVSQDAWYESITVRVWASARDWTERDDGTVVGGNDRIRRRFSEYWTFLRAQGNGGSSHDVSSCPSCGAVLDRINAAGICGYCESRIVSGKFDWVLSRIDQPEVYQG